MSLHKQCLASEFIGIIVVSNDALVVVMGSESQGPGSQLHEAGVDIVAVADHFCVGCSLVEGVNPDVHVSVFAFVFLK